MSEVWARFKPLRGDIDVTLDDTAIDGTAPGYQLTDFTVNRPADTSKGVTMLPPWPCTVQIGFYGASPAGQDDTASFGCQIWAGNPCGPIQKVCDITACAGADFADFTSADASTRLFYDDLTVADDSLWGDVTTRNLLSNGMGIVEFTSRGYEFIFPRFYNVGDGTECDAVKALMRTF